MGVIFSLIVVGALVLFVYLGVELAGLRYLFGVVIPYVAFATFLGGIIYRVVKWAQSPVPFRIPTTCGQQKSLPWIKYNKLEAPASNSEVVLRMALEILLFRSLFRNLKGELKGRQLIYGSTKWLWLGALAFHVSFFVIFIRHLRFFTQPVPGLVQLLDAVDGFLQIGAPHMYVTDVVVVLALLFLFVRRLWIPQVRYISHAGDYFPLFLILGLVLSGISMRYFTKTDIVGVKELTMGLATFHPKVPEGVGLPFFIHLGFVCALFIYFPFSKLVHMAGVFLSPTRNLPNNSREVRHINPWNYPVKFVTYKEWEETFRDKLIGAGIPLDEEGEAQPSSEEGEGQEEAQKQEA
ncbi:menaquinol oxidoreductase [Thermosulfuriphilus ammonigenes]|uniref:Menaquinol oxidoreductase n=1 Tax=Thermosulfuriphilus ammonigenes TaxID=1936021 RepID=A0A6G7PT34_9BACT|nr:sulfate reduction electron transfer complex DsrMKJOP subunit DsrM [Thermosulfuriphilus ammonigenes]MBA2849128.1 nitrate reductase gamma subunit [Thermosulfuriphilus ammonigenes]QIJ70747.1 menaquinol oxidoreductase [Thermosulfuriphilus ammonigenes]